MVSFTVKNGDLVQLIKCAAAKGVIAISPTEKITSIFFNKFFLEAVEKRLEIKAVDTQGGTVWGWHKLEGVEVIEEGRFGITDVKILLDILSSFKSSRLVNFVYEEDTPLTIITADNDRFKGFEVDEWDTMTPREVKNYNKNVVAFLDAHGINENGIPHIGEDDEIGRYSTILHIDKSDLMGVINQSIRLTLDQDISVSMDAEGNTVFKSGKANSFIKAKDVFNNVTKPIEFDAVFNKLQPIIPHLFNEIDIFMRIASDKKLKWWIRSKEKNLELNFVMGSL